MSNSLEPYLHGTVTRHTTAPLGLTSPGPNNTAEALRWNLWIWENCLNSKTCSKTVALFHLKKKKKKMWRNTKSQQHENASVFCKPVLLPWHFWSKSCHLTNHSLPSKEWVNTEPALWPAHSACHMNWQSESVTQSRLGWAGNPVCYNCSSFKWAHLNRAAALWTLRRYLRSARRQEVLARNLARPQLIFFTRAGATLLLSRLCFH